MKKTLVVLLIIAFSILSFTGLQRKRAYLDMLSRGVVFSAQEECDYSCNQSALWAPIGIIGAVLMMASPRTITRSSNKFSAWFTRIYGLTLFVLSLRDLWINCKCSGAYTFLAFVPLLAAGIAYIPVLALSFRTTRKLGTEPDDKTKMFVIILVLYAASLIASILYIRFLYQM